MKQLFNRMIRVIRFDQSLFDEIIADATTQGQSVWAVAIFSMFTAFGFFSAVGGAAVNIGLITTIISWYVWAFSISYIGRRMLLTDATPADHKTIMRVVAFASAPGLVRILAIIPKTIGIIFIISSIWILIATVLGLRKVFKDADMAKITGVAVVTWVAATLFQAILMVTLVSVFGVSGASS